MPVSFGGLAVGKSYTRPQLAEMWGYGGYEAIARGAVTPAGTPYIILFITKEKQSFLPQYQDKLYGERLIIEGETNHAADRRLVEAASRKDEIHLFYRERHHEPFEYKGQIFLIAHELRADTPSHFEFSLSMTDAIAQGDLETELLTHGAEIDAFIPDAEGRRRMCQSIAYERSPRNRAQALKIHGTTCLACRFDFNKVYGAAYAANYIEVHHVRSITQGIVTPDPAKDLAPLCSNCHSMAHRRRGQVLGVEELRSLIEAAAEDLAAG
jgi:5-methylcytosine-specific restriction protein A